MQSIISSNVSLAHAVTRLIRVQWRASSDLSSTLRLVSSNIWRMWLKRPFFMYLSDAIYFEYGGMYLFQRITLASFLFYSVFNSYKYTWYKTFNFLNLICIFFFSLGLSHAHPGTHDRLISKTHSPSANIPIRNHWADTDLLQYGSQYANIR